MKGKAVKIRRGPAAVTGDEILKATAGNRSRVGRQESREIRKPESLPDDMPVRSSEKGNRKGIPRAK